MTSDYEYFLNKRPNRIYISKAFAESSIFDSFQNRILRILSKVTDSEESYEVAKLKGETVLQRTPGGRYEIKAVFYQDSREIKQLTIQRFTTQNGNPGKTCFTFSGDQIDKLYNLLQFIQYIELESGEKQRLDDDLINEWLLSVDEKRNFFLRDLDLVAEIAAHNVTKSDIIALGYRKSQLKEFEALLNDALFFDQKMRQEKVRGPEGLWQRFFENNPWIFGYGLQQVFLSQLDGKKLEQVTSGHNVHQSGKRVDAFVKTRGYISSLCFIEIKTHRTSLLHKDAYRAECWNVSAELAGSIAQVQKTVQKAVKELQTRLDFEESDGVPTGEVAFMYQPKAYVVIGSLQEFVKDGYINEQKFSSFELFRRNITNPEIVTFDELFERAKNIVEHSQAGKVPASTVNTQESASLRDEDIPF